MKLKTTFFSVFAVLFVLIGASTVKATTEVGNVLYSDVRNFINGHEIPSLFLQTGAGFNSIAVSDLTNYGFNLAIDINLRTVIVTFDLEKQITPLPTPDRTGIPGNVAFRFFTTDWRVFINNREVDSWSVAGRVSILFAELEPFGSFSWNSVNRESRFTTRNHRPVHNMYDVVSSYQSQSYEEFTGGRTSFNMAGLRYTNGATWMVNSNPPSFSIYNLNGDYRTIRGVLGHVDGSGRDSTKMLIFADGRLIEEIDVSADMLPKNISINVRGVRQLKIEFVDPRRTNGSRYGFGNVVIE
jgi:hypothetical protein